MMILQSERLYVRAYTPSDLGDFYMLTSDPDVMRYIRPVKSMEETRQFLLENIAFYVLASATWPLGSYQSR